MDPNYQPPFNPENDNIDIKRYLSLFISNWYWFLAALFISLAVAYGINRYSEKTYTVTSTLLIKDDQLGNMNSSVASVIPGGDIFRRQQNLNNEMGILKSLLLNYITISELRDFDVVYVGEGRRGIVENRMYRRCPFIVKYDSLHLQTPGRIVNIKVLSQEEYKMTITDSIETTKEMKFGERFSDNGFDFIIEKRSAQEKVYDKNGSNKYYFWFENPYALANRYRNSLTVAPIEKDASLVTLSISGPVPEQEADYLNKLMAVYIRYGLDIKNETARNTIDFIDGQLAIISDSLTKAEKNLEEYRMANNFFDLSREGTAVQDKLKSYENTKMTFELQLQYYNYLEEYLKSKEVKGSIISPALMGITDNVLIRLVGDMSELQRQKETMGFNVTPDQPIASLMANRIEETRKELQENVRNGIETLKRSIIEEERKIARVESQIKKLPSTERNFIGIQRKFELNNTVYTYLLEKRAEAGIAKASNVSDNRIVDPASFYSTALVSPKKKKNLMMALILGLILPSGLIIALDFLNDKIIDKRDIEKKTGAPVIGFIGHSALKSPVPVIEKPGSAFSESFRSVRTALKYYVKENEKSVIAVTSTISSEGKTFVSVNLAAIIAMSGKKVLLIGLDLRKPRINKIFNNNDSPGMSGYLSGNCRYEEVIKNTHIGNVFYAPSGPIPPNPAELLEREEMKLFISKARQEYDFIIIDTPPVAIVTDTMLIAPFVDINLFIVRQRYTSRGTLDVIEQVFRQGNLKNMSIILNDISLSGYYGYGIRYGYSVGYGYYYGHNYYGKGYYSRYQNSSKAERYYADES